ncbi:MAG: DUF6057 family protein [Bacteroidales bacterium]|nr:DUF6057 family protein [Bacteroidales bacterium]
MRSIAVSGGWKIFYAAFSAATFIFFGVSYENHLIRMEQLQLFQTTAIYLADKLSVQGGFADYTGEFLVQFFGLPFAGAVVTGIMLSLVIILTGQIIRLVTAREPLMLFSFLPAAGWFLLLQNEFYSFSGVPGFLISLFASRFYLTLKQPSKRIFAGILLIPIVYWLTGAAYMTFVLVIVISEIIFRTKARELKPVPLAVLPAYLVIGIMVPLAARFLIIEDTLLQAYISGSYFRLSIFFPFPLVLIVISVPCFILLQEFLPFAPFAQSSLRPLRLNIISSCAIMLFLIVGILAWGDFRAEDQMEYDNLVYREKWNRIIEKAEREQPTDRLSMVAVNLALAKTGQLSARMFSLGQSEDFLFSEYERRGMTPFLAGEPFYHLGFINFAQMVAFETLESTPDAKFPSRSLIRIASTYLINGQYDIARKYLEPLSHTVFYRKWARECIRLSYREDEIRTHPVWAYMRSLSAKHDFFYNAGQMDVALRYLLLSNPRNKMAYEYLMAFYLLDRDLDSFLKYLPLTRQLNYDGMPKSWQEAAAYIATRLPDDLPQLEGFRPDQETINRIKAYADLFSGEPRDTTRIRQEYGDTYWYYLHFVK